jgi:hypothetical protein
VKSAIIPVFTGIRHHSLRMKYSLIAHEPPDGDSTKGRDGSRGNGRSPGALHAKCGDARIRKPGSHLRDTTRANGEKYYVLSGMADKPAVDIGYLPALRFVNWLHNGAQRYATSRPEESPAARVPIP